MAQEKITDWGEDETRQFLVKEGLGHLFEGKHVTGADLLDLDRLERIGIRERGDRLRVFNTVIKYQGKKSSSKVLNDPIHSLIELHPLLIKIIDTPQFQRLRYLKQLGGAYFVYPGGSHNRFEHSIGVAHLAGELAKALRSKQPELGIDERDILCVQIAGLCHDLGHGPFSHLYDQIFIPKVRPKANREENGDEQWQHENASLLMLDHLVDDNGLKPLMELYGLKPEEDLVFIKEMIHSEDQNVTSVPWPFEGRNEDKSFLYEIVANKLNGIDVDKFDYLARDTYHLGMQSNFDHKRFIMLARVCEVKRKENTRKHICSRDKEVGNLYDMFHTRYCLHRRVCQHKTHKIIEMMISDAFLKADEHITIEGSGGNEFHLSTAKDDMVAYTKLTDQVFERILYPFRAPELEEASNILKRIVSRDLYKFVGETKLNQGRAEMPEEQEQIVEEDNNWGRRLALALDQHDAMNFRNTVTELEVALAQALFPPENQTDNVKIDIVTLDYGMRGEDPINHTYFYSKRDPTKGFKISENQKSKLLPASFSEKIMRVYCKNARNISLEDVRGHFIHWCTNNGFAVPEDEEIATDDQ